MDSDKINLDFFKNYDFIRNFKAPETSIERCLSMFYNHYNNYMNLEKVVNKYNIKFEFVLNLRSDFSLQQELNLQNLNNNSFNIPKGDD